MAAVRAEEAGLSWPLPPELTESELEARLFPPAPPAGTPRPLPDWGHVHRELRRPGVTLQLPAAVEQHEGLPPVQQESHTRYFQDKFNQVFPGLSVAGADGAWMAPYSAARQIAYDDAEAHSASLDATGGNLGCNIQFF